MTKATRFGAAPVILLLTIAPGHAGSCQASIDRVQAQADAIIENRAAQGQWRPESLAATRNYQPTPRSLAAAEGAGNGSHIGRALNALDRARAAERSGNAARCNAELNKAKRALAAHSSNLQSD
jgi:hypothetical protein